MLLAPPGHTRSHATSRACTQAPVGIRFRTRALASRQIGLGALIVPGPRVWIVELPVYVCGVPPHSVNTLAEFHRFLKGRQMAPGRSPSSPAI